MKCPKCGYNSFEHLEACKKCGNSLAEHKAKFNLRGFYAPGTSALAVAGPAVAEVNDAMEDDEATGDESVDFGFDFLDEEEDQVEAASKSVEFGADSEDVSIEQPFGADSETIPADDFSIDEDDDEPGDKPGKGPEFAF